MMKRAGRICLILAIVVVLSGLLLLGGRRYLASHRVAAEVASRLEEALGIPVHVGTVDVRWKHTSLRELELFEPGSYPSSQPWAPVQRADTRISAWDLLPGT